MTEEDIKIFLKAKKEQLAADILLVIAVLFLIILFVLEVLHPQHEYTIVLSTLTFVALLSSYGSSRWVSISKKDLLGLIQRQIDADSEALTTLSNLKKKK